MADFDKSGFAAVDAFFGEISTDERTNQAHAEKNLKAGGKRLGVGAVVQPLSSSISSTRILQVGKRRRNQRDEDEELSDKSQDDEESDQDDEAGRTAIQGADLVAAIRETEKIPKTKKLGKKERGKLSKEKEEAGDLSVKGTDDVGTPEKNHASVDDDKKTKRKRRKIRSRQKNIVKDKRDVKPTRLVPGSKRYEGRPMTLETRHKLNMPIIVKSPFADDQWAASGDWTPDNCNDAGLDAMPLAVDQPQGDDTGACIDYSGVSKIEKPRRKKKKSKYKNL